MNLRNVLLVALVCTAAAFAQNPITADGPFHVAYAANPAAGESYINIINTGANGAALFGPGIGNPVGNICVNIYAFSPDEQEIACCSCLLTPNSVANLGVNRDLTSKTLTGVIPSSVVIKLVTTLAGGVAEGGTVSALTTTPLVTPTVEVRIINTAGGGDTGWVTCAGTSCSFNGTVGNYSLAAAIAIQNDGLSPFLDLSYDATTSVAHAGTLTFEAMAGGYTVNFINAQIAGNGNSTLGDTVSITSYGGNNNTVCPAGVNSCTPPSNGSTVITNLGPLPENLNVTSPASGASTVNPYSLGLVVTVNNPVNAGGVSGDIALDALPDGGPPPPLGNNCGNSAAIPGVLASGLVAFGTTPQPVGTIYKAVEHTFVPATLSPSEYASITNRCANIIGNGSGFGICETCRQGALGATKQ